MASSGQSGSPDSPGSPNNGDDSEKRRKLRHKVASEIVETENSYIDILHILRDVFLGKLSAGDCNIFTREEISLIFSDIPTITGTQEVSLHFWWRMSEGVLT